MFGLLRINSKTLLSPFKRTTMNHIHTSSQEEFGRAQYKQEPSYMMLSTMMITNNKVVVEQHRHRPSFVHPTTTTSTSSSNSRIPFPKEAEEEDSIMTTPDYERMSEDVGETEAEEDSMTILLVGEAPYNYEDEEDHFLLDDDELYPPPLQNYQNQNHQNQIQSHHQHHHHHQQQQLKNNNIRGGRGKNDEDDDAIIMNQHVILMECEYPRPTRPWVVFSDDDDDDESHHNHHRQQQQQKQQKQQQQQVVLADIGILSATTTTTTAAVLSVSSSSQRRQQQHDHDHDHDHDDVEGLLLRQRQRQQQRLSSSSSCLKRNQICQPNTKSKLGGICVDVDVDVDNNRRDSGDDDGDDFVVYNNVVGNNNNNNIVYYDDADNHDHDHDHDQQPNIMYDDSLLLLDSTSTSDAVTTTTQRQRKKRHLNNNKNNDNCFYQDGFEWDFADFTMTGRRECFFMENNCNLFDDYCTDSENKPCVTISQLYLFDNQLFEDVKFSSGLCQNFTKPYEQSICTFITDNKTDTTIDDIDNSNSDEDVDVSSKNNKVCEIYFDNEKCSKCTITSKVPGVASYCIEFDCTNTGLKSFGSTEMNGFAMFPILQSKKVKMRGQCTFDFSNNSSMPLFYFNEQPRCPFHITESKDGNNNGGNGMDPIYRGLIGLVVGFSVFLIFTLCLFKFWKPMPPISAFSLKNLSRSRSSKSRNSGNKNQQHPDDTNVETTENHSHDHDDHPGVLPVVDGHQL